MSPATAVGRYTQQYVIGRAEITAIEEYSRYDDSTVVTGVAVVSAVDQFIGTDSAVVIGTGIPSADVLNVYNDAAVVVGVAIPIAIDIHALPADAGIITGIGQILGTDTFVGQDNQTVTGLARATAVDLFAGGDSDRVTGLAVVSASENYVTSDASVVTGDAVVSGDDAFFRTEAGTVTGVSVPSAVEFAIFSDQGVLNELGRWLGSIVTGISIISDSQQFIGVDAGTVTGISIPAVVYTDADVVTGIAVISMHEPMTYTDADTVTGIAQITADEVPTLDADTVTGVSVVSANELLLRFDSGVTTGLSIISAAEQFIGNELSATATGVAVPSAVEQFFAIDAGTVTGIAVPIGRITVDGYNFSQYDIHLYDAITSEEYGLVVGTAVISGKEDGQMTLVTGVGVPDVKMEVLENIIVTGIAIPSADEAYTAGGSADSLPTVTEGTPDVDTSALTAVLSGVVNPGNGITSYWFDYGLTTSYGTRTTITSIPKGTDDVSVSANLSSLTANKTYHWRLVAQNALGTTNGTDATFSTVPGSSIPSTSPNYGPATGQPTKTTSNGNVSITTSDTTTLVNKTINGNVTIASSGSTINVTISNVTVNGYVTINKCNLTCSNLEILNAPATNDGLTLTNATGSISHSRCMNNQKHGVVIGAGCSALTITNFTSHFKNGTSGNTQRGINITAGTNITLTAINVETFPNCNLAFDGSAVGDINNVIVTAYNPGASGEIRSILGGGTASVKIYKSTRSGVNYTYFRWPTDTTIAVNVLDLGGTTQTTTLPVAFEWNNNYGCDSTGSLAFVDMVDVMPDQGLSGRTRPLAHYIDASLYDGVGLGEVNRIINGRMPTGPVPVTNQAVVANNSLLPSGTYTDLVFSWTNLGSPVTTATGAITDKNYGASYNNASIKLAANSTFIRCKFQDVFVHATTTGGKISFYDCEFSVSPLKDDGQSVCDGGTYNDCNDTADPWVLLNPQVQCSLNIATYERCFLHGNHDDTVTVGQSQSGFFARNCTIRPGRTNGVVSSDSCQQTPVDKRQCPAETAHAAVGPGAHVDGMDGGKSDNVVFDNVRFEVQGHTVAFLSPQATGGAMTNWICKNSIFSNVHRIAPDLFARTGDTTLPVKQGGPQSWTVAGGDQKAHLNASTTFPSGTVVVNDSLKNFVQTAGTFVISGQTISYTSITRGTLDQFNGCTGGSGTFAAGTLITQPFPPGYYTGIFQDTLVDPRCDGSSSTVSWQWPPAADPFVTKARNYWFGGNQGPHLIGDAAAPSLINT